MKARTNRIFQFLVDSGEDGYDTDTLIDELFSPDSPPTILSATPVPTLPAAPPEPSTPLSAQSTLPAQKLLDNNAKLPAKSRFKSVSDSEISDRLKNSVLQATQNSNQWAINAWEKWRCWRNSTQKAKYQG